MSQRSRSRVVVVGAGLAGLAAAWALSRRGYAVAVYERSDSPGGRVRGAAVNGFVVEPAGSLLSTGDRRLIAWIDEVGRRDDLLPLRPVVAHHCAGGRPAAADARNLLGIARIPGIGPRDALRLLRLPRLVARYGSQLDPDAPERAAALDDRSLADFGRLYFGPRVLAHWLAPFVTRTSPGDAEDLSRALFLRRYRVHPDERLGLPRGALAELVDAAAERLPVRYGHEVTRVERGPRRGMAVTVAEGGAERRVQADAVVVTVSAPDAARIAEPALVSAEREALAQVSYGPAATLAVGLRRPFHPHPHHIQFSHGSGFPLETALLEPGLRGGRVPDGRGLALLQATEAWSRGAEGVPEETARKELLAAFARLHPDVYSAVVFQRLTRAARAWPRFAVGHYRRIARLVALGRDLRAEGRRLYLAGDYLADPSLEGALASAQRSVADLNQDLPPLSDD